MPSALQRSCNIAEFQPNQQFNASGRVKTTCQGFQRECEAPAELGVAEVRQEPHPPRKCVSVARLRNRTCENRPSSLGSYKGDGCEVAFEH